MAEPEYARRLTSRRGVAMGKIAAIHGAYAVVELNGGCGVSLPGRVCALCRGRELTEKPGEIWAMEDVIEALGAIFKEGAAEFVLFQLGYLPGDDAGLKLLLPYIETVRRHFDTIVAVSMHPPADPRAIERAYASGVDALELQPRSGGCGEPPAPISRAARASSAATATSTRCPMPPRCFPAARFCAN